MDEVNYTSDGNFEGNILIEGGTGCGKTTFVQNLGKNNLFGDIRRALDINNWTFQTKWGEYQGLF